MTDAENTTSGSNKEEVQFLTIAAVLEDSRKRLETFLVSAPMSKSTSLPLFLI